MTIYERLKKDHKELQATLDELSVAESTQARQQLVEKVREQLVPHSRAEEAVFYNVLRDTDEAKDLIGHAYGEHLKAETLLRGLQVTEAVAMHWKSGVSKLKEDIAHHIEEEEGQIFSAAKKALSTEEATAIGNAFVALKPKVGTGFFQSQAELLVNIMPTRFRKSFLASFDKASDKAEKSRKAS